MHIVNISDFERHRLMHFTGELQMYPRLCVQLLLNQYCARSTIHLQAFRNIEISIALLSGKNTKKTHFPIINLATLSLAK